MMAIVFMRVPLRVFAFVTLRANNQTINEIRAIGCGVVYCNLLLGSEIASLPFVHNS
jgi:hypothetical protein